MTRPTRSFAPLLPVAFVLIAVASVGCPQEGQQAASPPPAVVVATVEQRDWPVVMTFNGTLRAFRQIDIIPRVSGSIVERHFVEGDVVQVGDPLYTIDPRPYQASLDASRAQLASDEAQWKYYRAEGKRYTELAKKGAASSDQRDQAVSQSARYEAATKLGQANVESAELDLAYTRVVAPFAGQVQQTQINTGQVVTGQETVLTQLVQLDPIHAEFHISRSDFARIQALSESLPAQAAGPAEDEPSTSKSSGLSAELERYVATLVMPTGETAAKSGVLDFLGEKIDPTTDTLRARARFANAGESPSQLVLVPGQYVSIELRVGIEPNALLVPKRALQVTQSGQHALVVDSNDVVERRAVTTEPGDEHFAVVRSGLKAGDLVIVEGAQRIKSKMKVTVTKSTGGTHDSTR